MSEVSVFKFNISRVSDYTIINSIITNYLNENGFYYNYNEQCFMIGEVSEQRANEHMALEIVGAMYDMSRGISHIYVNPNIHPCLTYQIEGSQLIIKAYTLNDFANIKSYIHSNINTNAAGKEYYNNLKLNLFNKLYQNNIQLISTEKEKVKDKSSSKLFKKIVIIVLPIIILFGLIALFSYLSTN